MTRSKSRRRRETPGPAGFLAVDKPRGWTSHDAVDAARRWLGTRRVGHLGTLDPQATGVLPLAVREATKLVNYVEDSDKSYIGSVRFGVETDTLDGEGRVVRTYSGRLPDEQTVRGALAEFRGDIEQIPPMFSAVKLRGVPLHRLARKGEEVERAPKKVRIHRLELLKLDAEAGEAEIVVDCSAGTYVRTLASDLGQRVGCGAYLLKLRRVKSGPFHIEDAASADEPCSSREVNRVGTWQRWRRTSARPSRPARYPPIGQTRCSPFLTKRRLRTTGNFAPRWRKPSSGHAAHSKHELPAHSPAAIRIRPPRSRGTCGRNFFTFERTPP